LSPKWEPAKRGGKPVSIEIKYPMNFKSRWYEKGNGCSVVLCFMAFDSKFR
jgi:hypothetical protein